MNSVTPDLKSIFGRAAEIGSPAERAAFLNEACGQDAALRSQVEGLLAAAAMAGSFMGGPAVARSDGETSPIISEGPGTVIGPYRLLAQIGEGGFGVVFLAEQERPVKRRVALKIIKPGMDTRDVINRFEAERQALAVMDHPNIAKVLDAGATDSGRPYFVMELVNGPPVTRFCDERHLTPRERLELFVPICRAVQHAHQKGIIHRDLKPGNILVALYDDEPVPKIIDFGVAKAISQSLTDKAMFTQLGQVVGTLEYMSPEQAERNQPDIDTRSDIYSLGVVLYELLTGETPFDRERLRSAAFDEMLRIIREEEPSKPSVKVSRCQSLQSVAANRRVEPAKLGDIIRGELDWIVMKALEKERERRYASANGFAADVLHYLADEPVEASPPSATYRFRKFVGRNKGVFAAGSVVTFAIVVAMIGLAVSNVMVRSEKNEKMKALDEKETALSEKTEALREKEAALIESRKNLAEAQRQETVAKENAQRAREQETLANENAQRAREQEQLAKENELLARHRFYATQMNLAMQAWNAGDTARVVQLLEDQRPKPGQNDLRTFEWYYLWQLSQHGRRRTIHAYGDGGTTQTIFEIAYSHDGSMLASAGYEGTVRIWDPSTGEQKARLDVGSGVWTVAFTRDGHGVVTGDSAHRVLVWDLRTQQIQARLIGHQGPVLAVAVSPDGQLLASGGDDRTVILWDMASGARLATLEGHTSSLESVAFSPDSRTLTSTGWDGTARLWSKVGDVWKELRTIQAHSEIVRHVGFSPDGKTIATGNQYGLTKLWDVETGKERGQYSGIFGAFSPDGRLLVTYRQRTFTAWDITTGQEQFHHDHLALVHAPVFSPDGSTIAAASSDGLIELWDVKPASDSVALQHSGGVKWLKYSPDGITLFTGGNYPAQRWNMVEGTDQFQSQAIGPGPIERACGLALSPDGLTLAEVGPDKSVKLWDARSGELQQTITGEAQANGLRFSPDGKSLATWNAWGSPDDRSVRLLDASSGQQTSAFITNGHCATIADISPDGRHLAAGVMFNGVVVWDLTTGQQKHSLDPQPPGLIYVFAVAFSPDGKTLVAGDETGTARLWDVETGRILASFKGHTRAIHSLTFSPDGKTLVTGSDDGSLKFWDPVTGQERLTVNAHRSTVTALEFSPDGNLLVSGSTDGTVRLWRASAANDARSPQVVPYWEDRLLAAWDHRAAWELIADPEIPPQQAHKAVGLAKQAVELIPDSPDYWCLLGGARYRAEQWPEAIEALMKSEQQSAGSLLPYNGLFLAMTFWKSGHSSEARTWFERAATSIEDRRVYTSPTVHKLVEECAELLGIGNLYSEEILEAPQSAESHRKLGWFLFRVKNSPQAAIHSLREAARLAPDDIETHYLLGCALQATGDWQEAAAEFEHVVELQPGYRDARDQVENSYRQYEEQFLVSARDAAEREEWTTAAKFYNTYLDRLEQPVPHPLALWQVVREMVKHDDLTERVLERRWDDYPFCRAVMDRYVLNEEWERALAVGRRRLERHPDDSWTRIQLSAAQLFVGDVAAYRESCREMLNRFSDTQDRFLAERVAKTCFLRKDSVEDPAPAQRLAQWAAFEDKPEQKEPWTLLTRGMGLYRSNDFQQAAATLTNCLEYPRKFDSEVWREATALTFLGMCRYRLGETGAAQATLAESRQRVAGVYPHWTPGKPMWGGRWHDCLQYQIAIREAEALMKDPTEENPAVSPEHSSSQ